MSCKLSNCVNSTLMNMLFGPVRHLLFSLVVCVVVTAPNATTLHVHHTTHVGHPLGPLLQCNVVESKTGNTIIYNGEHNNKK